MPADPTQFCLKIDFRRGVESPARVFQSMTGLIEACEATDRTLLRTITPRLSPILLLDDVETGSIYSILRQTLEGADDEALKSGDYKKIIGSYLVRGKHKMLQWIKEREKIDSREDVLLLQNDLQQLAEDTKIKTLPVYEPVSMPKLVENMEQFEEALSPLTKADKAFYITDESQQELNKDFHVDADAAQDILTEVIIPNTIEAFLKIKKPDYLGQSMWEMVYGDHTIEVKILDATWLAEFQSRRVDVRPGDALVVKLRVTVRYGYDSSVIATHYEALKIEGVRPWMSHKQTKFLPNHD